MSREARPHDSVRSRLTRPRARPLAVAALTIAALAFFAASAGAATRSRSSTAAGYGTMGVTPAATLPNDRATRLVHQWADCVHRHGDPHQPDPTIDAHGVIHITVSPAAAQVGDPHDVTGTCSAYLAAAQRALRAAHPVSDPGGVGQAAYLKYVKCMRTSGVPDYPYPEPNDPTKTDFIGSGVDPNSPSVLRVNDLCGEKLGLPTWWIKGYGPPGDITVGPAGLPKGPPACMLAKNGCSGNGIPVPRANV